MGKRNAVHLPGNYFIMSGKTSNTAKAIIGILLLVIAVLAYQLYNTKTEVQVISSDKELLISQLEDAKTDLMAQTTQNDSLNAYILDETARLNDLIAKAKSTNATNTKAMAELRSQVSTLRKTVDRLRSQVDSVNRAYGVLNTEKTELEGQFSSERAKNEELTQTNDKLSKDRAEGARLKLTGIEGFGLNVTKSGEEKETTSAAKVKRLKVCFTVGPNALAKKGEHTVYFRVNTPENRVMAASGDNTFAVDGKEQLFSSKSQLNFNGDATQACATMDVKSTLAKGAYTLELFADGRKLGEAKVVLN
jgi:hypothetical protein